MLRRRGLIVYAAAVVTPERNPLGVFLKDRRARCDPAAFGFACGRRRTPGLRREEVAGRAGVSVTWYTWLEQGRGGAPSDDLLDRLARALMLTPAEREHLLLLSGRRKVMPGPGPDAISPRLRRILTAVEPSPAYLKNHAWDVLAWNRAAAAVLSDYDALPPAGRNVLRILFCDPATRAVLRNWEDHARLVVATFRRESARVGAGERVQGLVDELHGASDDFARFWRENDVGLHGEGDKLLDHPVAGPLSLEFATFAVDGRSDLAIVIYTPAGDETRRRIDGLLGD